MQIQIRTIAGGITNIETSNSMDVIDELKKKDTLKVSFDFIDGARLALYADGTYQIFGGVVNYPLVNYPHLTEHD